MIARCPPWSRARLLARRSREIRVEPGGAKQNLLGEKSKNSWTGKSRSFAVDTRSSQCSEKLVGRDNRVDHTGP